MSRNHNHKSGSHSHIHDQGLRNISVAFVLNLIFSIIEIIGGLYTNSVAILSDALHDMGDSISLGMAWLLQKKSNQKRDEYYSYGYKRFSLLGAIIISFILIISSIFIIRESIDRLNSPEPADATGMLVFAIFGILINGYAAYRLNKGHTFNERAVSLHMLEDVLGWAAVLVVSIIMHFAYLPILDPILSLVISLWVLTNVYKNLRNTFRVLMQEVPRDINVNEMLSKIRSLPHIEGLHDFHLWSLDGEKNIMTLHIVTSSLLPADGEVELKKQVRDLALHYKIQHVTIEFETASESEDCRFADDSD